ncbi:tol-pal system YbgF family protein [Chitinimonas sp.]|uniref:tetratricopeptide repeat protein n=1 Tax=Chitinimonas sp. TaxID=1934313 RepID=UPI0035B05A2B
MAIAHKQPGITPYWECFPSFFLYPFNIDPLLTCLGVALLSALGEWLFMPLSLIARFAAWAVCARFAFRVLEKTAIGYLEDSPAGIEAGHGGKYLAYKQIAVIFVATFTVFMVATVAGPVAASAWGIVLALLWPASTMILAVSDSMMEALNPERLWRLVSGMGLPYLGLSGLLLLLVGGNAMVAGYVFPHLPELVQVPLAGFVAAYFAAVMARLMGYTLYQYHEEAGTDVARHFGEQGQGGVPLDAKALALREVSELIREGQQAEALQRLRELWRDYRFDIDVNERLHKMLVAEADAGKELLEHGNRYIAFLLAENRMLQAARMVESLQRRIPDYQPERSASVLPLAKAMLEARLVDGALRLIKGFDKRYVGHADIPEIYLLGARILCEYRNDDAGAARILTHLLARYPNHPVREAAESMMNTVQRLMAQR